MGMPQLPLDDLSGAPSRAISTADPVGVRAAAGLAHHRDDLLDPRRVCRVSHPLVRRRAPRTMAGRRGRRSLAACGVQQP
jgi:hypothetical protein